MKNNKLNVGVGSPKTGSPPRTWRFWLVATFLLAFSSIFAQTDRIPVSDGAFSNGASFAANNWSVSNGATPNHQWLVSSAHGLGAPFAGNAAFVSDNGTAYNYTPNNNSNIFFWRDVTVPAGEIIMNLSFNWNQQGESSWDLWQVFVGPTSITPVGNNTHPGSGTTNVPTPIAGATYIGNGSLIAGIQSFSASIPASFAGTTFRVFFSWKNETGGTQPPAAIDNIRLTSALPANFNATAQGGLWSDPATWVGGVVPAAGNDITIPVGSTVIVNQVLSYRDLTVNGNLFWNGTFATTLTGNFAVGASARVNMLSTAGAGQTINIAGDMTNNGLIDAYFGTLNFNGTGNSQLSGSGTFQSVGGRGIVRTLQAQNNGTFTLNQTQNITVTNTLINTSNNFITNGKIRVDNAVDYLVNRPLVMSLTAMGSGYTTAPVVLGQAVSPWVASGAAAAGTRYFSGTNVYLCTTAGTFGASAPANTAPATETNGSATVLWIGNLGNIGNSFIVTAVTAGTQYYCGNNLYICTGAGTPLASAPPVHTSGTAVSGTATFAYVGTVAKVSLNYDGTTQTVRSLNIVSEGSGYQSSPAITISNTGAGTGALAATLWSPATVGPANSLAIKATASIFTGAVDTRHSDGIGTQAGNGVYSATPGGAAGWYNTVPTVGFTLPPLVNLVSAQGSGYTTAPTIVVSGGTLVSGLALTAAAFQVNVADGRVISLYCLTPGTTAIYSVPPTITVTGGGGSGATFNWTTFFPTATVTLSNGTTGFVTGITITNNGIGYVTAPTMGFRAAVAGEVAATAPTCRLQQLNLQWGFYSPQTSNPNNNSIMALLPSNRRINAIAAGTSAQTFTSNVVATALVPLVATFGNIIDMGGSFNFRFSHPDYVGQTGAIGAYVANGSVELSLRGGIVAATRTFPIGGGTGATAHFVHTTGSSLVTTAGYTYTGVRVIRTAAPSGTVSSGGNLTGIRGVKVDLQGTGVLTNLNTTTVRTMQMNYNILDNLVSNNQSLFLAEATALTGPWTARSAAGLAGALASTGNRVTATIAPGPYTNNTSMFFAWVNNGFTPPPPLAYNVTRSTAQTYNSIATTANGGDNSGTSTTFSGGDDAVSPVISLVAAGNNFTYQGETVTGFRISTNGLLQLETASAATSGTGVTNNFSDNGLLNVIAPFWDDLTAGATYTAASAADQTKYKITGTAPNRTVIVDWANYTIFGAAGPQLFFQVEMIEATNTIKFNYGNMQLFNGTNNHRYTYSTGLKGRNASAYPNAGEVFALTYENTNYWSNVQTQSANLGANGLLISPEPRSTYTFTPGAGYVLPAPPTPAAPANDNAAAAQSLVSLSVFPNNIAWDNDNNKPRIYTTRYATTSPQTICAGPVDAKDVWFSFVANEATVTARIYASGGYIPRVEMLKSDLTPLPTPVCVVGAAGGQVDATSTGLTIGNTYYVRVYHNLTGAAATFAASAVVSGAVTGVSITSGGTNYTQASTGTNPSSRMEVSGGGGTTFVGAANAITGGVVTGGAFDGGNDFVTVPTLTIEEPDWGISGQFAIVIYAPPINDNCTGAIALTNANNSNCVTGQNELLAIGTGSATPSSELLGSCSTGADDDLWYSFVATGTSTNLRVQGNLNFDPALQLWTSFTDCAAKVNVAIPAGGCVNATGANGTEEVLFPTAIGQTYWVRVYHAGTGSGGPGANFNICVTTPVPTCISAGISPADLANECATPGVVLSWTAVQYATSYDVYFDAIDGSTLVQNQAGVTYNPGILAAGTWFWKVTPKNANGDALSCPVRSFTILSPTPTGTTAGSRCGTGTVGLSASGSNLRWWQNPTGGVPLATGANYTTPSINTPTNYYVSAGTVSAGVGSVGTGTLTTNATGTTPYGTLFEDGRVQYLITAAEMVASGFFAGNITSLGFDVTAVGTPALSGFTVKIGHTTDAALAAPATPAGAPLTVYTNASLTPTVGINTYPFSSNFNWNGTQNIYIEVCFDNSAWSGGSTVKYTATTFNSVFGLYQDAGIGCSLIPGTPTQSINANRPNIIFNGQTICSGPRTAVLADVLPPPALTLSSASEQICFGVPSSPVSISSTASDYDNYSFAPATGISGGATGPWTFNPAASTNYVLTATNSSTGCVNTTNFSVTVNANPPAGTATLTANPVCQGSTANLNTTFNPNPNILTQNFESGLAGWAIAGSSSSAVANFQVKPHGFVGSVTVNSPGDLNCLFANPDAGGSGTTTNTQFTSPVFSLVGYTAANLSFRHSYQQYLTNARVQVSIDGGTTWPFDAATYTTTQGGPAAFVTANVSLTAYAGNPNVRIRFNYIDGWAWHWAIDDIIITGTAAPLSYAWTGPNSFTSASQNPAITNVQSADLGVYNVIATNGSGCTATASTAALTMQVNPTASLNLVSGSAAPSNAISCATGSVVVGTSLNENGGLYNVTASDYASINWTHDGNGTITAGQGTLTPTYTVNALDAGNLVTLSLNITRIAPCTGSYVAATYVINVRPNPTISLSLGPNAICNNAFGVARQLDLNTMEPNTTYLWSVPSDLYTDNLFTLPYAGQSISTVYSVPFGAVSYSVTATNSVSGCVSTSNTVALTVCAALTNAICDADLAPAYSTVTTGGYYNISLAGATTSGGLPCAPVIRDVYYRVLVPASGEIHVTTAAGTNAIPSLNVQKSIVSLHYGYPSGAACSASPSVACNAGGAAGDQSYVFATGMLPGSYAYLRIGSTTAPNAATATFIRVNIAPGLTWTGAANTSFTNPANYLNGDATALTFPNSAKSVLVRQGTNQPVVSTNEQIRSLITAASGHLTINTGNTLSMTRNVTGANTNVYGNGWAILNGTTAQVIDGTITFSYLRVNNNLGVSITAPSRVGGLDLQQGALTTGGNLTVLSNAGLTGYINNFSVGYTGSIVGTVNMERRVVLANTSANANHYITSPVAMSGTVASNYNDDFSVVGTPAGYVYNSSPNSTQPTVFPSTWTWDETLTNINTPGWTGAGGTTLLPGQGFSARIPGTQVVDIVGIPNNGAINRTVTYTAGDGLNLIGNPYPSSINFNTFATANSASILPILYIWNPATNSYASYNGSTWNNNPAGILSSDVIGHSQSFFVFAKPAVAPSGTVNFNNTMRTISQPANFFSAPEGLIRLEVSSNGHTDEAVVMADAEATENYDEQVDARKLLNAMNPNILAFTLSADNTPLAINAMDKFSAEQIIPVQVIAPTAGDVNIKLNLSDLKDKYENVYLEDATLGTFTDLKANGSYTAAVSAGNSGSRFFLHFEKPSVAKAANELGVYAANTTVFANLPSESNGTIEVVDLVGKTIYTANFAGKSGRVAFEIPNAVYGSYIVKLTSNGKVVNQKVLLTE